MKEVKEDSRITAEKQRCGVKTERWAETRLEAAPTPESAANADLSGALVGDEQRVETRTHRTPLGAPPATPRGRLHLGSWATEAVVRPDVCETPCVKLAELRSGSAFTSRTHLHSPVSILV